MAATKRKKGAVAAERADSLTVRFSPEDRNALELLAAKRKTSLSAVVVGAVRDLLQTDPQLRVRKSYADRNTEDLYLPDLVWHPLEPDRTVKVYVEAPGCLTARQIVLMTVAKEKPGFFEGDKPNVAKIREHWGALVSEADALIEEHGK